MKRTLLFTEDASFQVNCTHLTKVFALSKESGLWQFFFFRDCVYHR